MFLWYLEVDHGIVSADGREVRHNRERPSHSRINRLGEDALVVPKYDQESVTGWFEESGFLKMVIKNPLIQAPQVRCRLCGLSESSETRESPNVEKQGNYKLRATGRRMQESPELPMHRTPPVS